MAIDVLGDEPFQQARSSASMAPRAEAGSRRSTATCRASRRERRESTRPVRPARFAGRAGRIVDCEASRLAGPWSLIPFGRRPIMLVGAMLFCDVHGRKTLRYPSVRPSAIVQPGDSHPWSSALGCHSPGGDSLTVPELPRSATRGWGRATVSAGDEPGDPGLYAGRSPARPAVATAGASCFSRERP